MLRPSLIAVLACAVLPVVAATVPFHAPKTATEKVLDKMIHRADADNDQLANLLGRPWAKHDFDYTTLLTPRLIAQLRAEEKAQVKADCGGKYLDGEVCGFDYSPIGCDQDEAPHYFYRTLNETADKAVIEYAWPESKTAAATYTLLHGKAGWRIDNIVCSD